MAPPTTESMPNFQSWITESSAWSGTVSALATRHPHPFSLQSQLVELCRVMVPLRNHRITHMYHKHGTWYHEAGTSDKDSTFPHTHTAKKPNHMSWFDDDPELLRAALDILDTWNVDGTTNDISVASPSTDGTESSHSANDDGDDSVVNLDLDDWLPPTETVVPAPPVKVTSSKRANAAATSTVVKTKVQSAPRELKPSTVASTRHRRREEIIYLRDKVQELETQLGLIKQNKEEDRDTSVARDGVDQALAVMWHDISNRQQKLRQKSELEHAKLRTLLETQVKVAQGLLKLMQKARKTEEDTNFPTPKRAKYVHDVSLRPNDDAQLALIDERYANLDDAFTFAKFHDGSTKFIDVNVDDREEEIVLQLREAWSVPFKEADVMQAVWLYSIKASEDKACRPDFVGQVTVDGDILVSRFTSSANVGTMRGNFEGGFVTKRFNGTDGRPPAILKSMMGKTREVVPGALSGVYMQEVTTIRVRQVVPAGDVIDDKPMTVVQTVQRFHMTFDDDIAPAHRRQAGQFTDFLLEHLHQDIELKHETVETLLLQSRTSA